MGCLNVAPSTPRFVVTRPGRCHARKMPQTGILVLLIQELLLLLLLLLLQLQQLTHGVSRQYHVAPSTPRVVVTRPCSCHARKMPQRGILVLLLQELLLLLLLLLL